MSLDLWRGLVPSLALILNPAINYTTFGLVKGESQGCNWLGKCLVARLAQISCSILTSILSSAMYLSHKRHNGCEQLDAISTFVIGVISKIVATTATYPLIRAKVFLMVSGADVKGLASCLRLITKESGYTGLYAGYSAQLLRVALKSSILLVLKEKIASIVLT